MKNDYSKVWQRARQTFSLSQHSVHGPQHWKRVEENGLAIAKHSGADIDVVKLFAALHDVARQDDGSDPQHGPRAALLAEQWRGELFELDGERFQNLLIAIRDHTKAVVSDNATIGTCWDADRLDLPRVGIMPRATYLSTDAAKRLLKQKR
jgi:uncharacterized protein